MLGCIISNIVKYAAHIRIVGIKFRILTHKRRFSAYSALKIVLFCSRWNGLLQQTDLISFIRTRSRINSCGQVWTTELQENIVCRCIARMQSLDHLTIGNVFKHCRIRAHNTSSLRAVRVKIRELGVAHKSTSWRRTGLISTGFNWSIHHHCGLMDD